MGFSGVNASQQLRLILAEFEAPPQFSSFDISSANQALTAKEDQFKKSTVRK
jgi:hypothetical protein